MINYLQCGSRTSEAEVYGGLVQIVGQIANDREAGVDGQIRHAETDAFLAKTGASKSRLAAINIFLPKIGNFEAANVGYDAWVDRDRLPARACVEARFADPNVSIEITPVTAV